MVLGVALRRRSCLGRVGFRSGVRCCGSWGFGLGFVWFDCFGLSLVDVLLGRIWFPFVSGMCGAGGSRAGCDGS